MYSICISDRFCNARSQSSRNREAASPLATIFTGQSAHESSFCKFTAALLNQRKRSIAGFCCAFDKFCCVEATLLPHEVIGLAALADTMSFRGWKKQQFAEHCSVRFPVPRVIFARSLPPLTFAQDGTLEQKQHSFDLRPSPSLELDTELLRDIARAEAELRDVGVDLSAIGDENTAQNTLVDPDTDSARSPLHMIKRTYQPSWRRRKRRHGYLRRMRSKDGRKTIARRIRKGRKYVSV